VTPEPTRPTGAADSPLPGPLLWAVRLIRAEAAALGALAVLLIYEGLTATASNLVNALFVTVFAIGGAVLLWLLAGALANRRAGARAPAIVFQLLLLPVGYQMTQSGLSWLGVPLIGLGLLITGLLVSPPTTRAMGLD
jgi:hypothetical protein